MYRIHELILKYKEELVSSHEAADVDCVCQIMNNAANKFHLFFFLFFVFFSQINITTGNLTFKQTFIRIWKADILGARLTLSYHQRKMASTL